MTHDEAEFNTKSIIGAHPNTYTFTYDPSKFFLYHLIRFRKFIAEHIMSEEKGDIPYAILRPSIIGASQFYPFPV
jgi:hypothetical protein